MNLIEQLENLIRTGGVAGIFRESSHVVRSEDLRAIIEQHKQEVVEPVAAPSSVMRDALMRSVDVVAPTQQPELARCKSCNGNDYDMPCAYPSEGKHGCLRDARLTHQTDHTKLIGELVKIIELLESDPYAASFQSMAQYRKALLTKAREAIK